jgi:formylglycine-generating enzyme required for sulfatase activity
LPLAHAQQNLPPEARAQIAISRVSEAIAAGNNAAALWQLQEMEAQGLPRSPSILIAEARLAGQARDFPRAMAALEGYFKAAKPDDPNYVVAGQLYTVVERFLEDAKRAAKAADDAAWARASAVNSCAALIDYYGQAKTPATHRDEALRRLQAQACTNPPAVLAPASQHAPVLAPGATPAPLTMFRDCETCPDMIALPAGSFTMGSRWNEPERQTDEGPQRMVRVPAFAVGRFEVTFDEWDACVADRGCEKKPADQGWGRGKRPVMNVSWIDAKAYTAWLSRKTGQRYRLLTEAEWEYAARGGKSTAYWWGSIVGSGNANCNGCGSQWDNSKTAPVGSFQPNAFGLFDTAGNVSEWVEDCRSTYAGATIDGSANTTGICAVRVVRGGSWSSFPRWLRSAYRNSISPTGWHSNFGFRLARTVLPPAP